MTRLNFRYSLFNYLGVAFYLVVVVTLGYLVSHVSLGSYTMAWYITVVVAVTLLLLLSMPRYIALYSNRIEVHCLVEVKSIRFSSINSVEKVSPRELSPSIMLVGWGGFGGSVGRFFLFKRMRIAQLYVMEPRSLLRIETKKGQLYYISCPERDSIFKKIYPNI